MALIAEEAALGNRFHGIVGIAESSLLTTVSEAF